MICPILHSCQAQVDFTHHQTICSCLEKDAYLECEHFKQATEGTKRPLDWSALVTPTPR